MKHLFLFFTTLLGFFLIVLLFYQIFFTETKYPEHLQENEYFFKILKNKSLKSKEIKFETFSDNPSSPYYKPFWVKPEKVKPILYPKNLCLKNKSNDLQILVYAFTKVDDFKTRCLIRKTWGSSTHFPFSQLLFVLGISTNTSINLLVKDENEKHGDIYQSDFIDTYKNLSYKSITAWRWISKNCMKARLIVKSDDDMIVNLQSIHLDLTKNSISLKNTFTCLYASNQNPVRDKFARSYMPLIEYKHEFYKIYCGGEGIIMSTDLIPYLYKFSYYNNNLWIDDVNVGEIAKFFKPNFNYIGNKYTYVENLFEKNFTFDKFYFIKKVGYHEMLEKTWKKINSRF